MASWSAGAKAHNSCSIYVDEIIAIPTRIMTAEENDWAVAFAVSGRLGGRSPHQCGLRAHRAPEAAGPLRGDRHEPVHHRVRRLLRPVGAGLPCGRDASIAGKLALLFALYHRHSYTGCKAAVSEIYTGATALAAEYNGIDKAQHVRHKLADMIQVVDLIYAAGLAAA